MKRLLVSFTLGLSLLALAAVSASGSHTAGPGPQHDMAVGTGQLNLPTRIGAFPSKIHVNAISDADGSNARGHFSQDIDTGGFIGRVQFSGDVTCLNVNGNTATIGGVITKTTNSTFAPVGAGAYGTGMDNGEGQKDPPDALFAVVTGQPPPNCNIPLPPPFTPIDKGNYVVHDAS